MQTHSATLRSLLDTISRKQFVNGKPQSQVVGCVLRPTEDGESVVSVSLVRDGKTSLGRFSAPAKWGNNEQPIIVPDIDRLCGVLSAHSGEVFLTQDEDKLRIKSGKKRTTLHAQKGALAFPHSTETIAQWEEKSLGLSAQITDEGYKMRDGSMREPFFAFSVPTRELGDALKCDSINAQKMNNYTFQSNTGRFTLSVGDFLKGQTDIELSDDCGNQEDFETVLEGGLEHIVNSYSGEAHLHFLDFRPEGQGVRLIMRFDNGDWVYQSAVLRR
jgi:hypothetical protein